MSELARLCENSDVGLARRKFVSITLNKKRTALAVTVERGKERKQFCAFSARARFHTAWVRIGPFDVHGSGLLCPRKRKSRDAITKSVFCHNRKSWLFRRPCNWDSLG